MCEEEILKWVRGVLEVGEEEGRGREERGVDVGEEDIFCVMLEMALEEEEEEEEEDIPPSFVANAPIFSSDSPNSAAFTRASVCARCSSAAAASALARKLMIANSSSDDWYGAKH